MKNSKPVWRAVVLGALLCGPCVLVAGDVEIVRARLVQAGGTWQAHVTLRHADAGWKHYADAWRVKTPDGEVLGTRTLYHPHVDEQPFTRSLGSLKIPAGADAVLIEAHDLVHGWSADILRVDMRATKGPRFEVRR